METVTVDIGGRPLTLETGKMARQASGSILARYGDTMVLATVTSEQKPKPDLGFFPLSVHYVEKAYAAGRIPGGFLRREGRLSDHETLTSRFIDRSIRPLFPKGYQCETQVVATVLSADLDNAADVVAMVATSAALAISDIPFEGPIAGCRVVRIAEEFVVNPSTAQLKESNLDIFVSGSEKAIIMVEGVANEIEDHVVLEAVLFGHKAIQPLISEQKKLASKIGIAKRNVVTEVVASSLVKKVEKASKSKLEKALQIQEKPERYAALAGIEDAVVLSCCGEDDLDGLKKTVRGVVGDLKKQIMREAILKKGERIDGRKCDEIRPITCETGLLPRAHGSALFTRGETQALVTVTLGNRMDEQLVDNLMGVSYKDFLFHYNFPPFCVGEVRPLRGPGRREIGHGMLAEKGVTPLLPQKKNFPYTLRVASEILESNGSSSMASVCGASLAMMDAGVPIERHAAGIAMGLIQEKSKVAILSDILGDEDHLGDMDFKVAGTRQGITALQMDVKISGITEAVMSEALAQAKEGRMHILGVMEEALRNPNQGLSPYAPRMVVYRIKPARIKDVIGPGGKIIKGIIEETGAKVDVDGEGLVTINGPDHVGVEKALEMIKNLTQEIEIGSVYNGPVRKVLDFGAFVELVPGSDGLLHISEFGDVKVNEGDMLAVRVSGIDRRGKFKLALAE